MDLLTEEIKRIVREEVAIILSCPQAKLAPQSNERPALYFSNPEPVKYINVHLAAVMFEVSANAIYLAIRNNTITCIKKGRNVFFDEAVLIKFKESGGKIEFKQKNFVTPGGPSLFI